MRYKKGLYEIDWQIADLFSDKNDWYSFTDDEFVSISSEHDDSAKIL